MRDGSRSPPRPAHAATVPAASTRDLRGFLLSRAEQGRERRKRCERVEPETLQELRRRRVQQGTTRRLLPPGFGYEPSVHERPQDPVGIDTPDRRDLVPGHRLFVGYDGEGFESGL